MSKFIILSLLVLLLAASAFAQFEAPYVIYVTVAPSGACTSDQLMRVVRGSGAVYTCQSLTWAAVAGGGGGSGTVTQVNTGAGLTGGPITTSGTISSDPQYLAWKTATVTLTSAQILAVSSGPTPFQLVAGVSGHYYSPVQATAEYIFNTVDYTCGLGAGLQIQLGAANQEALLAPIACDGLLNGGDNIVVTNLLSLSTITSMPESQLSVTVSGLGLFIAITGGSTITAGNGTLKITVIYQDTTL